MLLCNDLIIEEQKDLDGELYSRVCVTGNSFVNWTSSGSRETCERTESTNVFVDLCLLRMKTIYHWQYSMRSEAFTGEVH